MNPEIHNSCGKLVDRLSVSVDSLGVCGGKYGLDRLIDSRPTCYRQETDAFSTAVGVDDCTCFIDSSVVLPWKIDTF